MGGNRICLFLGHLFYNLFQNLNQVLFAIFPVREIRGWYRVSAPWKNRALNNSEDSRCHSGGGNGSSLSR